MRCADALDSDALREIASSDVFWDKIVSSSHSAPSRSTTRRSRKPTISWQMG